MTIVGKILVFVNLVFSLVVGGLVMVVYLTRTHWEEAYRKRDAQVKVITADRDQVVRTREDEKQRFSDEMDKLKQSLQDMTDKHNALIADLRVKENELNTLRNQERKDLAEVAAIQESLDSRRRQVEELEMAVASLRKDVEDRIEDYNNERRARIQADVEKRTAMNRALELENQVRELARELVRSKVEPTGVVTTRRPGEENPPLENIEGRIVTVDPEHQLVQLSIGSDAGLAEGHTLKVFRMQPDAKYLGVIEILAVRPKEAVGRPLRPMSARMQPNDRVASRLLTGN